MKRYLLLGLFPALIFANTDVTSAVSDLSQKLKVTTNNIAQDVKNQNYANMQNSDPAKDQNSKIDDNSKNVKNQNHANMQNSDPAQDQNLKQDDNSKTGEQAVQQENKTPAEIFLEANAKKPGVVSLNENLQYQVLEAGTGSKPTMHSSVTVHYEGTLLNGTEFDSSFKRKEPATFSLDQVIQGWTEALPHMQAGSTWMVYIGPKLAYGDKGIPGVIPPNSVLIFKIKLIKVNS